MKHRALLQVLLSLLLGGVLCYLAMRDWQWGDIVDTMRPLSASRLRLLAGGPDAPQPGTRVRLEQDGVVRAELTLPAPQTDGPERGLLVAALPALAGEPGGAWQLRRVPDGTPLPGWALDFRSPAERARSGRAPRLLATESGGGGAGSASALQQQESRGSARPEAPSVAERAAASDPLLFQALRQQSGGAPTALVRQVAWGWLLPYALLFCTIHLLRIVRWGMLLRPLGHLSFRRLLAVGSVGFMAILIFPLRLGEFVRPYLVSRESDIRMTAALATCVVERVVDGLAVVLILFVVLAVLPPGVAPPTVVQAGYLALALFLGVLGLLLAFRWKRALTLSLLDRTIGRVAPGLTRSVGGLLDSFLDGVRTLPSPASFVVFLATTALYWLLIGFSFWALFRAVGITLPSGADPGLLVAFAVMVVLAIGIIVPAGPAFAGSFELSLRLGLSLFLAPAMLATRGAAYILLLHTLQFSLQVVIGIAFLLLGGVSLRRVVSESQQAATGSGTAALASRPPDASPQPVVAGPA